MLDKDESVLAIVVLVVLDAAVNAWWGSETPYGQEDYTYDDLRRFEIICSGIVILYGLTATVLTRKWLPLVAAIVVNVVATGFYEYEYTTRHPAIKEG